MKSNKLSSLDPYTIQVVKGVAIGWLGNYGVEKRYRSAVKAELSKLCIKVKKARIRFDVIPNENTGSE